MPTYPDYQAFFHPERGAASLRVLRARNAALILCFLQQSFKAETYNPVISHAVLLAQLTDFLQDWNITGEEGDVAALSAAPEEKAAKFLRDWVQQGYLTLYTDDQGEDQHCLTPALESVLDWVTSQLTKRSFVGTESRFLDILQKLRELVRESQNDWEARVAELETQRADLDRQIRELKLTRTVQPFEDYQVKERFEAVNALARSLLKDFREVEGNFRHITQQIYQEQTTRPHTKGSLLTLALDALDELRQTDQGRSFDAFYQHLNDPRQKAELDELIRQVFDLLQARDIAPGDAQLLRKIKSHLLGEGQKVNTAFQLLARKLEKIVAEKNLQDRRQSLALMRDIRGLAFEVMDRPPPPTEVFLELDGRAEYCATAAEVSLKPRQETITARELRLAAPEDAPDLTALVNRRVIDKSVLIGQIQALLLQQSQVSLQQVVQTFGLRYGLTELLAYGSIAAASAKHLIRDEQKVLFDLGEGRACEFPELIFCR
ncbi:DUF3375 family protein [Hymenobacter aquaticus]|uniref:DUF3375 family protein n=1 Tax=Hymenobacter aquaticus TaxID=1867101 RepID=A0A4Z0Q2N5_9BACT|nr:DUF3375 family protein [Hymenobacter aquaticus]TGE23864.1 DUF3375 family protein [Hymenobacter aquaticus]